MPVKLRKDEIGGTKKIRKGRAKKRFPDRLMDESTVKKPAPAESRAGKTVAGETGLKKRMTVAALLRMPYVQTVIDDAVEHLYQEEHTNKEVDAACRRAEVSLRTSLRKSAKAWDVLAHVGEGRIAGAYMSYALGYPYTGGELKDRPYFAAQTMEGVCKSMKHNPRDWGLLGSEGKAVAAMEFFGSAAEEADTSLKKMADLIRPRSAVQKTLERSIGQPIVGWGSLTEVEKGGMVSLWYVFRNCRQFGDKGHQAVWDADAVFNLVLDARLKGVTFVEGDLDGPVPVYERFIPKIFGALAKAENEKNGNNCNTLEYAVGEFEKMWPEEFKKNALLYLRAYREVRCLVTIVDVTDSPATPPTPS